MSRSFPGVVFLLLITGLLTTALPAFSQDPFLQETGLVRAILIEKDAFVPGEPEMISTSRAGIHPNPTGRYVLITRRDETRGGPPYNPTNGAAILVYDSVGSRTRVLWEQPDANQTREGGYHHIDWLPGTNIGLIEVQAIIRNAPTPEERRPYCTLLFFDADRDVRPRPLLTLRRRYEIRQAPTRAIAAIEIFTDPVEKNPFQVRFVTAQGRLSLPVILPDNTFPMGWTEDEKSLYVAEYPPRRKGDYSVLLPLRHFKLVPETGQLLPLAVAPKYIKEELIPPPTAHLFSPTLQTVFGSGSVVPPSSNKDALATPIPLKSLWLTATGADANAPPIFLAPYADQAWVMPDNRAVLYKIRGTLYAIPLRQMPRARYEELQNLMWRAAAMRRAEGIWMALGRYAGENDNHYPNKAEYQSQIAPYVPSWTSKEGLFLNPATNKPGFSYLMDGEMLRGLKADTPIGYLAGPGGRVVIYASGWPKWEDSPPNER